MSFLSNLFGRNNEDIASGAEEESAGLLNLSTGQQVLFTFVGVLVCGGLCMFATTTLLRPDPITPVATPEPPPDFEIPTAREAYVPAVELIRQEDPGALLASTTGVWHPNIDQVQLKAGRTGWTYHFYLPASNEMATVIVSRGGAARLADVVAWETPPDLLDDQRWQVDSPDALVDMLGICGDALAGQSDAYVEARLSTAVSNLTLLWQIDVITEQNPGANCGVNVDATTGIVRAR